MTLRYRATNYLLLVSAAPKLRGRTRKKPRQRSLSSPSSESTSDTEAARTETEPAVVSARDAVFQQHAARLAVFCLISSVSRL